MISQVPTRNTPFDALNDIAHRDLDYNKVPNSKPKSFGMFADLVIPGVLQGTLDPHPS